MSVQGMQIWLEETGMSKVLETNEMSSKRKQFNRLLEQGVSPTVLIAEFCKGKEALVVLLCMVLVEDQRVSISDTKRIPSNMRSMYPLVKQYLIHTHNGGRALPVEGETDSVAQRIRELAATR